MQERLTFIREQFPALDTGRIFFDNPGGTQMPWKAIDRMKDYMIETNANRNGAFAASRASDELIEEARKAIAEFVNAPRPEEIVFGQNMTSLTMSLSRSIAQELKPGDEIIVTRLDHDANISPWLIIAAERGCRVRWVDFDVEDCTLKLDELEATLSERTRLVAVGYASNAVGTINPVDRVVQLAHEAGALCVVDAVHYAPHGPIDVSKMDCDFLVVSAYKFFGPHLGILYGKYELLERLPAYKVRPAADAPPSNFETGTQNHEGIAGALGAIEYLEQLGMQADGEAGERYTGSFSGRRLHLKRAMAAVRAYEMDLSRSLLDTLSGIPGLRIYGITEARELDRRVPTVAFRIEGLPPREIAHELGEAGIQVWDGNFYALAVTERLGVEEDGGLVRVGLAHYNTAPEIDRFGQALRRIAERAQ